mmetsp:Transcript_20691/g.55406  ORF Transcript_20691/g.55406 Transcript_20691/m.55406 type:complete len:316 (-) Transcript_20691:370-1317(-)
MATHSTAATEKSSRKKNRLSLNAWREAGFESTSRSPLGSVPSSSAPCRSDSAARSPFCETSCSEVASCAHGRCKSTSSSPLASAPSSSAPCRTDSAARSSCSSTVGSAPSSSAPSRPEGASSSTVGSLFSSTPPSSPSRVAPSIPSPTPSETLAITSAASSASTSASDSPRAEPYLRMHSAMPSSLCPGPAGRSLPSVTCHTVPSATSTAGSTPRAARRTSTRAGSSMAQQPGGRRGQKGAASARICTGPHSSRGASAASTGGRRTTGTATQISTSIALSSCGTARPGPPNRGPRRAARSWRVLALTTSNPSAAE